MLLRNWVELGITFIILAAGVITKCVTHRKYKKNDCLMGINNYHSGRGWKMR